jgi:hypothetical protein
MAMPFERYEPQDPALSNLRRTLRALGLSARDLLESASVGYAEAALVEAHHPSGYEGYKQWAEPLGALRQRLLRRGWTLQEEEGTPFAASPDGQVVITAWRGDHNTGLLDTEAAPQRARPGGEGSRRTVTRHAQYHLDLEGMEEGQSELTPEYPPMWVMFHRRDGDFIRVELVLPTVVEAETGRLMYPERHILPPVDFGAADPCSRADEVDDHNDDLPPTATEPVDVPVTPRQK